VVGRYDEDIPARVACVRASKEVFANRAFSLGHSADVECRRGFHNEPSSARGYN